MKDADVSAAQYRFAPSIEGAKSLDDDPRIALLSVCIANQQSAGFCELIDIRQFACPHCSAPGFNTGWGTIRFQCGAEYHSDGEASEECPIGGDGAAR